MNASIVIPCYNSEEYIELCLAALIKQTVTPKEIIVVDSSTDSTPDIIKNKFPNVHLHHLEKQTMPGAARNIGIGLATGDIIIFTDSDAVAESDWIEKHIQLHQNNPNTTLFGGAILNQNPEHLFSRLSYMSEFTGYFKQDIAEERSIVPSVNMSVKREELKQSGVLMPETSLPGGEEVFFCNELIRQGHIVKFDPAPAIKHINRTTWKAYTSHMKSSGFGAGVVAAGHKVNFDFISKLGPLAILAAPVRLMLVMKRLFCSDKKSFAESILYSPLILWGMIIHMWHYYLGATESKPTSRISAALIPLIIITTITISLGTAASKRMSSDPSCYLNYGKMLANGDIFFQSLAAKTAHNLGCTFNESVMHGYIFQNSDGNLYPFVTIGFPAILAICIKALGLEYAGLTNIILLPLFLFLYMLILHRLIPDKYATEKKWVPAGSAIILFIIFQEISISWVGTYRELSSMIFAFSAIAIATYNPNTRKALCIQSLSAGLCIGIATIIRETSLLVIIPACLIILTNKQKSRSSFISRGIIIGLLAMTGLGIGIAPQLATNQVQRGSFTGKQFEAATHNLVPTTQVTDAKKGAESTAGFSYANFQRKIPQRMAIYHQTFQYYLLFFLLGLIIIISRKYHRLATATLIPATAYFFVYSAFDQYPGIPRYEMMIYIFAIPIIALGIISTFGIIIKTSRIKEPQKLINFMLSVLVILLCIGSMIKTRISPPINSVSIGDIKYFRQALDKHIDSNSIILCELSIRDYIEYLTDGSTASIQHFLERDVSIRHLSNYCDKEDINLFFFNAKNNDIHSTPYAINEIKGLLEAEANLTLAYSTPTNTDFRRTITGEGTSLFLISPFTNKVSEICLTNKYISSAHAIIDIGSFPDTNITTITSNSTNYHIQANENRFLVINIPQNTNTNIRISTTAPHRNNPIIKITPRNAAISWSIGFDCSENFILGDGWFDSKKPSANGNSRRLPIYSSLILESLSRIYDEKVSLFLSSYPMIKSERLKIDISYSNDERNWIPAKTAYYSNGTISGFLLKDVSIDQPIYIRNKTNARVYIHTLSTGNAVSTKELSTLREQNSNEVWSFLRIPVQADLPITVAESYLPPQFDSTTEEAIIPLFKLPLSLNKKLTAGANNILIEPIFHSGFYSPEKTGRWTTPEAKLILPPTIIADGGTVILYIQDNKPITAKATEVSI
ncbi:MAG: glycosyltransferase, partial [Kiritimatiellae bacterium]|nr:glycosyltransferase [Kiritimatiellia bacterium]